MELILSFITFFYVKQAVPDIPLPYWLFRQIAVVLSGLVSAIQRRKMDRRRQLLILGVLQEAPLSDQLDHDNLL